MVWLSATGKDGMSSGISTYNNIKINLWETPPIKIFPPYFNFVGDKTSKSKDGSIEITKFV